MELRRALLSTLPSRRLLLLMPVSKKLLPRALSKLRRLLMVVWMLLQTSKLTWSLKLRCLRFSSALLALWTRTAFRRLWTIDALRIRTAFRL